MGIMLSLSVLCTSSHAQNGDQILDGIGETGLIARYTFKENTKDWSRNNLHGTIQGTDYEFIKDTLFEKVLSLSGRNNTCISLPQDAISEEESISITTWIFLRSDQKEQSIFDFGKNNQSHFSTILEKEKGVKVEITNDSKQNSTIPYPIDCNKWNHLAIVFDASFKTLKTYINGKLVSEAQNVDIQLKQLFDSNNKLYIGNSIDSDNSCLNAKLYDFRIYRIPLIEEQVNAIRKHSSKKEAEAARPHHVDNLEKFSQFTPQLYNAYLSNVPDIQVETTVGNLPKLPRCVKGEYRDNIEGPDVIVLWPAPTDNSQVRSVGTYTITGKVSGTDILPKAIITVKEKKQSTTPDRTLEDFKLNQVTLNYNTDNQKTKFIHHRDKFINVLVNTNPDNFLYMFRNAFGKKQPKGARALSVWDSQECKLRGHATGHYLTAIAQAYASTGYDPALQAKFADKIDYMVNTLYDLSQMSGNPQRAGGKCVADPIAVPYGPEKTNYNSDLSEEGIRTDYWNWGRGYISAYPPDQFIMLEHGAKYGTDDSKVWAPYYTLHKILTGLMDIYEVTDNPKALEVAEGMGNWVYARLSQIPQETLIEMWNTYIAGEFGGMNEVMSRLYRVTGNIHYLETALYFDNVRVFFGDAQHSGGLAKNVDLFRGLHANQHIPQIMGALEIYRDSKKPDYFHIAENFWDMVTNDYMYSIGGVAGARNPNNAECFICQPSTLYRNGFSAGGQNETCATYNMLKLSRGLFLFEQRPEFMDYYERSLYNHILASVAEHSPANTYHVPLRAGSIKQFSNSKMTGFTCCNGTALESSTKLQNSIYFKSTDNKALYVNLYIPSTLSWTERNITVTQTTAYPKEDNTKLTINGHGKFDLKVRVPHWATKGFFVKINGKDVKVEATPGTYLTLSRKWKDGDTVELRMPFHFYLEPVMDQENIASLFYGPVLLAAQESESLTQWRKVTFDANDIGKSISGNPNTLEFNIDGVVYKPFFESYGHYSVYLDVLLK